VSEPSTTTRAPGATASPLADVVSGFLVFLIAMPLCLGIAIASGFPPVAGVLSAIVGGFLGRGLWSAPLTIKGPAAGLIVIAIEAVQALGDGDMALGYRRALAVGVAAAGIQVAFGIFRLAKYCVIAPVSVVHGMLAAIGVIIFAKQAHVVMGVTPAGKAPIDLILEIPWSLAHDNPEVLAIGGVSLVLLFGWASFGRVIPALRRVPAPLAVLLVAVPMAMAFRFDQPHDYSLFGSRYHVGPELLLNLPGSLASAITTPDFSVLATGEAWVFVTMFALIGSLESVLSVLAVDALDPECRSSDLDKDLLTVGVGNLASAMIGGLPMISEIVRSKANIDAGARTAWSNFWHGTFLLVFLAAIPGLLHYIPMAALAAMLVFTGARLASPRQIFEAHEIGIDQVLLFVTTLVVTLATDLLIGIGTGLALKLVLNAVRNRGLVSLFTTRVSSARDGDTLTVRLDGPASLTALLRVLPHLRAGNDPSLARVVVEFENSRLVDHTFLARVHGAAREWPTARLEFVGHEGLAALSPHPLATRRSAGGGAS
jgi:MFS superfamily sulfate permease-like transporter